MLTRSQPIFSEQPLVEADIGNTPAFALLGFGRADLAAKRYESAVEMYREEFGVDYEKTLRNLVCSPCCYANQGRHAKAVALEERVFEGFEVKYGRDLSFKYWPMVNLTYSYAVLGRYAEVLKLRELMLELQKTKLAPSRSNAVVAERDVVEALFKLSPHAEALSRIDAIMAQVDRM